MSHTPQQLHDAITSIKLILTARATGGNPSNSEYVALRRQMLDEPSVKNRLPAFVRTCRTVDEFWVLIKPMYATYRERSEHIRESFDPVLTFLENSQNVPSDHAVTDGLKDSAAEYIQETWSKAIERRADDPEGAITAARSLLESVCKHLLDELGEPYDDKADLPKLYSLTANKLNLAPSQHTEQVFKQILGGCHSVVEGIGALRNRLSDAHGKGKLAAKPQPRHAQLAVNLAGSMATFLVETMKERQGSKGSPVKFDSHNA